MIGRFWLGDGGGVLVEWVGGGLEKELGRDAGRCRRIVSVQEDRRRRRRRLQNLHQNQNQNQNQNRFEVTHVNHPKHQATTLQADFDDTLEYLLKGSVDAVISARRMRNKSFIGYGS